MDDLKQLLTDKTKIVALPHVSNLLGEVYDVAAVVKAVRSSPAGWLVTLTGDHCISPFQHAVMDSLQLGMMASDINCWCFCSSAGPQKTQACSQP